jgi:hypothetical protein
VNKTLKSSITSNFGHADPSDGIYNLQIESKSRKQTTWMQKSLEKTLQRKE